MREISLLGLASYLVLTASIYLMSRTDEASAAKIPPYLIWYSEVVIATLTQPHADQWFRKVLSFLSICGRLYEIEYKRQYNVINGRGRRPAADFCVCTSRLGWLPGL